MKRPVAMALAGAFTTLVVVGGTIAAAQSGAFTYTSTTVLPNGEINVPEITPTEEQPYTVVETKTIVIPANTAKPEPTDTAEPAAVVEPGPSEREAELTARLNQAYALLQQRDDEYQARLKEAYDKLKTLSDDASSSSQVNSPDNGAPSSGSPTQSQPQPASPTAVHHEDDKKEQQQPEHHDDNQVEVHHEDNTQQPQDQHQENKDTQAGKDH